MSIGSILPQDRYGRRRRRQFRPRRPPVAWFRSAARLRRQIAHLRAGGLSLSDPLLVWLDNRLDDLAVKRARLQAGRWPRERGTPLCHRLIISPGSQAGGRASG